jgi:hypothetical protein
MALIDCPECGREVSSSAAVCPVCAYPVSTGTPPVPPTALREPPKYTWWKTAIPLLGRVVLGVMLAAIGGDEEGSVAAVIGGTVIAGSAIPAWYRAKIERLKAGRAAEGLDDRFADRMAELEHRQQDQMDRLEQMHTEQMADLEERIDFAERLLTKQSHLPPSNQE